MVTGKILLKPCIILYFVFNIIYTIIYITSGGKRCTYENCNKAAQSDGQLCWAHGKIINVFYIFKILHQLTEHFVLGGGKRCKMHGCNKSVKKLGLCNSHQIFKIVDSNDQVAQEQCRYTPKNKISYLLN